MLDKLLSGLSSKYVAIAFSAGADGEAASAVASSLKKTMTMDDECVTKSRKVSAGLLRERCAEIDKVKAVNVCRQAVGNVNSEGRIGEYHHLRKKISIQTG